MSKTKEFIEFIQKFNEFMEDKTMRVAFVNYLNTINSNEMFLKPSFIEHDENLIKEVISDREKLIKSGYIKVEHFTTSKSYHKVILINGQAKPFSKRRYNNLILKLKKDDKNIIEKFIKPIN